MARYIERNPVKAELVKKAEEYPWSSAGAHLLGEDDQILSGEEWLPAEDRDGYRDFCLHDNKGEEELIRKATSTGKPFGTQSFIAMMEEKLGSKLRLGKRGRPWGK